jgi:hypothetical protein
MPRFRRCMLPPSSRSMCAEWLSSSVYTGLFKKIFRNSPIYKLELTHLAHFDTEDGGSIYLRNVGNTTHIHKVKPSESTSTANHHGSLKSLITR